MPASILWGIACLVALAFAGNALSAAKDQPIALGSRREPFVDHFLIEKLDGVELELQQPQPGGVAIRYDDGIADNRFSFFTTVLKDGPVYRMYYLGYDPSMAERGENRSKSRTCYAESLLELPTLWPGFNEIISGVGLRLLWWVSPWRREGWSVRNDDQYERCRFI